MGDVVIYIAGLAAIVAALASIWYLIQTVRVMWRYNSLMAVAAVFFSPFVHMIFYFMPKEDLDKQEATAFKRYFLSIGAIFFIGFITAVISPTLFLQNKTTYVPRDNAAERYLIARSDGDDEVAVFAETDTTDTDTWLQEQIAEDEIRRQEIARFVAENSAPSFEDEQESFVSKYDSQTVDYGSRYDYQNTLLETTPAESVVRRPTYYAPNNDQPYQYSAPINNTAPSAIVNCDGAGCWGTDGTRYNKGAGETYFPSNGGVCQNIGGQIQCN